MQKYLSKTVLLILFLITTWLAIGLASAENDTKKDGKEKKKEPKTELNFSLSIRDGICRVTSPIMVDVVFKNESMHSQKLCIYNFYDALLKITILDVRGDKVRFNPKLVTAGKISKDDWVEIPPGRAYKRTFSLNRKVINATGYHLGPGNYTVKATYEGCSKFDPSLPNIKIESNFLYLLVVN